MAIYHFGTNDGTVPWCEAAFLGAAFSGTVAGRCLPFDAVLCSPDRWCQACVKVYEQTRGKPFEGRSLRPVLSNGPACTRGSG